jgi:hypothetical protein
VSGLHPYDIGQPRVRPADLKPGHVYETPMGEPGPVLIVSVGPKWIKYRQDDGRNPFAGPVRKLPRAGWDGPYFRELNDLGYAVFPRPAA